MRSVHPVHDVRRACGQAGACARRQRLLRPDPLSDVRCIRFRLVRTRVCVSVCAAPIRPPRSTLPTVARRAQARTRMPVYACRAHPSLRSVRVSFSRLTFGLSGPTRRTHRPAGRFLASARFLAHRLGTQGGRRARLGVTYMRVSARFEGARPVVVVVVVGEGDGRRRRRRAGWVGESTGQTHSEDGNTENDLHAHTYLFLRFPSPSQNFKLRESTKHRRKEFDAHTHTHARALAFSCCAFDCAVRERGSGVA